MLEPELIQREREILRAFRQANAARVKVEIDAEARHKTECDAANATLGKVKKEAEAQFKKAHSDAESRLKTERATADAALKQEQQKADEQLRKANGILSEAQGLLQKGKWQKVLGARNIFPPCETYLEGDPKVKLPESASQAGVGLSELRAHLVVGDDVTNPYSFGIYAGQWIVFMLIAIVMMFFLFGLIGMLTTQEISSKYQLVFVPIAAAIAGAVSWLAGFRLSQRTCKLYVSLGRSVVEARHWYQRWMNLTTQGHQQRVAAAEAIFQQDSATARSVYESQTQRALQDYQSEVTESDTRYRQALSSARTDYESRIPIIVNDTRSVAQSAGLLSAPYGESLWKIWKAAPECTVPLLTRIGLLAESGQWDRLTLPAILAIIGGYPLVLKASGSVRAGAIRSIESLMFRLLATLPAGKLRFTAIDPLGLGQNVAPFMHLADYDEQLVTGKAWTEPQHIEQRLADLTEHLENVIQKYLRNQFATIEDYNAQAGEVAEPYRVLVVMDFPTNFSEAAARRLVSIAQNGPRCGVYAVILADTDKPLPHGFNLADLERVSTVIAWDGKRFVWQDEDFKDCQLELDTPPSAELFNRIITTVGEAAKEASKVEVPFERIAPPQAEWWTGDSRNGLRIALGPSGARKVQYLDLGKGTTHHVLVAGRVGAGKSTLLHTLINNLALAYSPTEVELYLIDFKKGVEFKTYATHQLPHARVIAIESEREFGLSVLQGLDAELKRRGDLFRSIGVDHIADYREKTNDESGRMKAENSSFISHPSSLPLPRILLLVDEFQEFFTEDDYIASQSSQILDRLVRQGRAFGIHVLLGSQTLAGAYTLARSTIDQMAVRIALQCSEADSRLILADDNPAARLLSRPGEAIYNASNGMVEGNNRFQVAWLPDDQRDRYLAHVQALAEKRRYRPPQPQIVFEGNAPAEVEKNRTLYDLLVSPKWFAPTRVVRAWIGEPVAIRESVSANFRPQSGSNLLIVGQNDEAALGIMTIALISLAAQLSSPVTGKKSKGESNFYILDLGATDTTYADFFTRLGEYLSRPITIGRRRQLPEIIGELVAEVQRRIDADSASAPAKFLFLYGLQRARDLRQEDSFALPLSGDEPTTPNPAQQFATILREGPDVGVHTLVWCDTLTNLNRSLDRRALREFAMRVVFQMGAEDSANLIDTPAASKLGSYRALFYSEEEGRLEKFRPYALPSEQWLKWVGEQLRGKAA